MLLLELAEKSEKKGYDMPQTAESAVRNYLTALRDPSALRDDEKIADLRQQLESSEDPAKRLQLRQQILDAESPSLQRYEDDFVTHAKAWAEDQGVTAKAFEEEGVPNQVLRKAGLRAGRGRAPGRRAATTRSGRSRVTAEEVRKAIPRGSFTIKSLQEKSGASPAVVRKVVSEEESNGRIEKAGTDPDHTGPGRAPTLYRRA